MAECIGTNFTQPPKSPQLPPPPSPTTTTTITTTATAALTVHHTTSCTSATTTTTTITTTTHTSNAVITTRAHHVDPPPLEPFGVRVKRRAPSVEAIHARMAVIALGRQHTGHSSSKQQRTGFASSVQNKPQNPGRSPNRNCGHHDCVVNLHSSAANLLCRTERSKVSQTRREH